jgi:hypothetical protein
MQCLSRHASLRQYYYQVLRSRMSREAHLSAGIFTGN